MILVKRVGNFLFSATFPNIFNPWFSSLSMFSSNKGKESASTYPCISLSGSVQVNGVDGVVLDVIQITDDQRRTDGTSAFNTRMVGEDVSSFLIQQGGRRG